MSPLEVLVAGAAGAASMWVFRRGGRGDRVAVAVKRMQACLMEFWLYVDTPALLWMSWRSLLEANVRLLRLVMAPIAILTVPSLVLYSAAEARHGYEPLVEGRPTLLTVQFAGPLVESSGAPQLLVPEGIAIDSPPVRVFSARQVSWRIRPLRPVEGIARCMVHGAAAGKTLAAGSGTVSLRRVRRLWDLLLYPTEPPLATGAIEWIEISYPEARDRRWLAWLAAAFTLGALVQGPLARRLERYTRSGTL